MTETVPADIAAVIDLLDAMIANRTIVRTAPAGSAVRIGSVELEVACVQARAALDAAILKHLQEAEARGAEQAEEFADALARSDRY